MAEAVWRGEDPKSLLHSPEVGRGRRGAFGGGHSHPRNHGGQTPNCQKDEEEEGGDR